MKNSQPLLPALLVALVITAFDARAQGFYEPFPYEPGLLPGAGEWSGEEAAGSIKIMPGSLRFDGLPAAMKNRVQFPSTRSKIFDASRPLGFSTSAPWFSFLIRVDKADGLGVVGGNDTENKQSRPFGILRFVKQGGHAGPGIYLFSAETNESFLVAASKRSNPDKVVLSSKALKTGVPHIIVGHLDNTKTPNALEIWLELDAAALAEQEPPEPTLLANEGVDLPGPVDTIVLGGGVGSPGILLDEIRVGESWAEVVR